jgi:hypothetical protein
MWEPRPLTTLWAFTACYRDSFTFFTFTPFLNTTLSYTYGEVDIKLDICLFSALEMISFTLQPDYTSEKEPLQPLYKRLVGLAADLG